MIPTHGLTHLSLSVADPERSLRLYTQVFGVKESARDAKSILAHGPWPHDVLAFELNPNRAGAKGGIGHFGFRLKDPADIDAAVQEVERAGGKLLKRGEFAPGCPFAWASPSARRSELHVTDPDGYQIEIWYE